MKKIVIVDDEMMNLVLEEHALADEYQVICATSGEEALKAMNREVPDLVLLDIEMPGMDGKTVARIMKEDDRLKEVPIVFLTADSDPDTQIECLKLGAEDFVIKPFVPILMKKRIGRILEYIDLRKDKGII